MLAGRETETWGLVSGGEIYFWQMEKIFIFKLEKHFKDTILLWTQIS